LSADSGIKVTAIDPPDKDIDQRAGSSILFVPNDWPSEGKDYVYSSTVDSVIKLLRQNEVPVDSLHPIDATTPLQDNRGLDWIAPAFLISGSLLTQNPTAVSIALGVIANYVTDIFKGSKSEPRVKFRIVQTSADGKKAQLIEYEGSVSGVREIEKLLLPSEKKE
jgi:hypothetical protein